MINLDWVSVSGIFQSHQELQLLMSELEALGLSSHVSILMSEETYEHYHHAWAMYGITKRAVTPHSQVQEGATAGSITGGLLGVLVGSLTLVGSVIVPGMGLLVVGPLLGALTGGALGTVAGGLVGALMGAGVSQPEAQYYEEALNVPGNILVVVQAPAHREGEVRSIFKHCGAQLLKIT